MNCDYKDDSMKSDSIYKSLMTKDGAFNTIDEIVAWIERRNREVVVNVDDVPFSELNGWHFEKETGNLVHDSGKFFSIVANFLLMRHTEFGCRILLH